MKESRIDYAYTRNFLERLNKVVVNSPVYEKEFIYKGYDLWHGYQQAIFSDAKQFSKERKIQEILPSASFLIRTRGFLIACVGFLYTVVSIIFFCVTRPKIMIYSVDKSNGPYKNDFRLNEVYRALKEKKISYSECFHTIFRKEFLMHIAKRKRFALYLESFDLIGQLVISRKSDITLLNDTFENTNEKIFAEYILKKYIRSARISRTRICMLKHIFSFSGIKMLLCIDDTRSYQEVVIAAHVSHLQVSAFQHGHFTPYHVGWIKMYESRYTYIKPTTLYVWSDYWKDELCRLTTYFEPNELLVATPSSFQSTYREVGDGKSILLPYETDAPKQEVKKYIQQFVSCGYKIYFKLRQDMSAEMQMAEYGFEKEVVPVLLLDEVISDVGCVVGTYSTFLYDMVARGIPVAVLETSLDYGYGMVHNGLANMVRNNSSCNDISTLMNISDEDIQARKEHMTQSSGKTITQIINKLTEKYETN